MKGELKVSPQGGVFRGISQGGVGEGAPPLLESSLSLLSLLSLLANDKNFPFYKEPLSFIEKS